MPKTKEEMAEMRKLIGKTKSATVKKEKAEKPEKKEKAEKMEASSDEEGGMVKQLKKEVRTLKSELKKLKK
jgi:hypothetical protein